MNRLGAPRSRRRHALGAALGVAVAVVLVVVVHGILASGPGERWWPAAVAAGFGGGVMGAMVGVEADGELPDEGYDGLPDQRRRDSA